MMSRWQGWVRSQLCRGHRGWGRSGGCKGPEPSRNDRICDQGWGEARARAAQGHVGLSPGNRVPAGARLGQERDRF